MESGEGKKNGEKDENANRSWRKIERNVAGEDRKRMERDEGHREYQKADFSLTLCSATAFSVF